MKASIIIVTRNRAPDLAKTLGAFRALEIPDGLTAELHVVDNGSTDDTRQVATSCRLDKLPLRYTYEKLPGKSNGQNLGLALSTGDWVLFTDDDVRPPQDWLPRMCEPLVSQGACAVAGGLHFAPHLVRSWMQPLHRSWLASSEWIQPEAPQSLVGANMAFSRVVLQKVPGFDPELGPGALGFGDDHLFASQLLEAGFPIVNRLAVSVEHHFAPSRLQRRAWLDAAYRRGKCHAYRGYHWEHWTTRLVWPRLMRAWLRLSTYRLAAKRSYLSEGCDPCELMLVFDYSLAQALLREKRRPRCYHRHGLVKLTVPAKAGEPETLAARVQETVEQTQSPSASECVPQLNAGPRGHLSIP